MKILAFGKIAEILQQDEIELSGPSDTFALREKLETEFPELRGLDFKMAVNKKIASEKTILDQGTEIALLPPFSGG